MLRVIAPLAVAVLLGCGAGRAAAEQIVWDYGPTTGLATPSQGGGSVLVNMSNGQNFVDTVSFAADTPVTGLNFYTSRSHLPPGGEFYHVRFLLDNGGLPGAVFSEFDVKATAFDFLGDFTTTGGTLTDIHRVSLRFDPVPLAAGTTYWVGASGLNFDIGLYGVLGPGDGKFALLSGPKFITTVSNFGDQMFQLLATPVPEPGGALLLALGSGLAAVGVFRARRRARPR